MKIGDKFNKLTIIEESPRRAANGGNIGFANVIVEILKKYEVTI